MLSPTGLSLENFSRFSFFDLKIVCAKLTRLKNKIKYIIKIKCGTLYTSLYYIFGSQHQEIIIFRFKPTHSVLNTYFLFTANIFDDINVVQANGGYLMGTMEMVFCHVMSPYSCLGNKHFAAIQHSKNYHFWLTSQQKMFSADSKMAAHYHNRHQGPKPIPKVLVYTLH